MRPPLGSAQGEERELKRDLDLSREYAFAPEKPLVSGILKKGSHFRIDWPKVNEAVYVKFETVLSDRTINESSVPASQHSGLRTQDSGPKTPPRAAALH